MYAKYSGTCARSGQRYGAGTKIVKNAAGKWEIAPNAKPVHEADFRSVVFYAADGAEQPGKTVDIALPMYCSCCKSRPDFDEKNVATFSAFTRDGDKLTCPDCGRTGQIQPKPEYKPETKRCWECGMEFTYAECKRNGGDWNENGGYCGC